MVYEYTQINITFTFYTNFLVYINESGTQGWFRKGIQIPTYDGLTD